jgi:hypothetical protein
MFKSKIEEQFNLDFNKRFDSKTFSDKNQKVDMKERRFRKFLIALNLLFVVFAAVSFEAKAQDVVDKTVATVGDGVGTPELITYSDLLWQMAMQPGAPLRPASSEDLNRALQLVINQRLFALEAKRVPRSAPTEAEIDAKIKDVVKNFPSTAEFEQRLRLVGFNSVRDENFERIMAQRVAIDKYLDFRFRSFVVITSEDEKKYYENIYSPEFRRLNPSRIKPKLEEVRAQINNTLTEEKVASEIEKFLDDAKRRAEIIVLSEV